MKKEIEKREINLIGWRWGGHLALVKFVGLRKGLALLEVGFTIQLGGFNVTQTIFLGRTQDDQISGELLPLFNEDDISRPKIPALDNQGGSFCADFKFDVVGSLV